MGILSAMLVVAVTGGARVSAADPPHVLPAEPGAFVLPDARVLQAATVDIDGDGAGELLRVVAGDFDGVFLEAWTLGAGGPSRVGEPATLLADQQPGRPDPIRRDAPVRLIVWRDGSRERALVAIRLRFEERDIGPPCCLILREPVITDGELRIVDAGLPSNTVDAVLALDLDGDGRDELLTSRALPPEGDVNYPMEVRVYRLEGDRFGRPLSWRFPLGSGDTPFHLGDTDGLPGEEAGVHASLGPGGLLRLAWRDGELVQEHSGTTWPLLARGIRTVNGPAVVAAGPRRLSVLVWPAGERATLVASASNQPPVVLGTLPNGDDTVILTTDSDGRRLTPLSSSLIPLLDDPLEPSVAAATLWEAGLVPYAGPLPLGADVPPTFAFSGRALRWSDGALVRDMASLPNALPLGPAGEDAVALLRADFFLESPQDTRGGLLAPPAAIPGASISFVPVTELLAAETAGTWSPHVDAPAHDPAGRAVSGRDGVDVSLAGPPGTLVAVRGGAEVAGPTAVPPGGEARLRVQPALPDAPAFDARLMVVARTPAGKGYAAPLELRVLAGPPEVEVAAFTPPLSPIVEVRGRVPPPATVEVAGRSVEVAPDGSFRAGVPAPPWPTRVELRAQDPVGNEAVVAIEVVGVVDYRVIPWVPVLFAATLLVAVALFVRAPRARLREERRASGGRIDEMRG